MTTKINLDLTVTPEDNNTYRLTVDKTLQPHLKMLGWLDRNFKEAYEHPTVEPENNSEDPLVRLETSTLHQKITEAAALQRNLQEMVLTNTLDELSTHGEHTVDREQVAELAAALNLSYQAIANSPSIEVEGNPADVLRAIGVIWPVRLLAALHD